VRYQFILQQEGRQTLTALCRTMEVSRSGFLGWRTRQLSAREQANGKLTEQIRAEYEKSHRRYGSPRVYQELKAQAVVCSEKRVARLMRAAGLRAVGARRFVRTTDSDHGLPIAENLLDRQFECDRPNRRWVSDITYVWTSEGWLYLAAFLDLCGRKAVGWSMSSDRQSGLVLEALEMAMRSRRPAAGLLCHSDRGGQYASAAYRERLDEAGAVRSMSRRGNCWDNAPMESFFASLKRELVYRVHFATREEARVAIFEWIAVWYNRQRRHSSLGYLTPEAYERELQERVTDQAA
jgi:putative transposase